MSIINIYINYYRRNRRFGWLKGKSERPGLVFKNESELNRFLESNFPFLGYFIFENSLKYRHASIISLNGPPHPHWLLARMRKCHLNKLELFERTNEQTAETEKAEGRFPFIANYEIDCKIIEWKTKNKNGQKANWLLLKLKCLLSEFCLELSGKLSENLIKYFAII